MRLSGLLILSVLFIFCTGVLYGQTKKDLETKKKKTLEEINLTNKLLKETKDNKDQSYNNLLLINSKISTRRQLIKDINDEVTLVNERIKDSEFIIKIMEDDLLVLSEGYARMVRSAWSNMNKQNTIMFIFSSKDFNQSYLRFKYMQQLAEYRKRQFLAINSLKDILALNIEKLNEAKMEKTLLLNEEKKEEVNLKSEQQEQQKTLQQLQGKEKELQNKLKEQQRQMQQLQKEIEKLIAEEAKKAASSPSGKFELTPAEKIISTNFGNNKGSLPWPVERGIIVSHYGKQAHPVLKNIEIENNGVDISTTEGAYARAIFDGEVKKIITIPGAQTAVIIRHGEYLSAYTHIETVSVSVGESVKAKQSIGKIYTDKTENKTILHFEIWKGSVTLNPSGWLAK
jgi:septal ring factor EnvC (AmiA/AmiB activator)